MSALNFSSVHLKIPVALAEAEKAIKLIMQQVKNEAEKNFFIIKILVFTFLFVAFLMSTNVNNEEPVDYIYECSSVVVEFTANIRDSQTFKTKEKADAFCDEKIK